MDLRMMHGLMNLKSIRISLAPRETVKTAITLQFSVEMYEYSIVTSVIKLLSENLCFCLYLRALNVIHCHPICAGCLSAYSIPSLDEEME